MSSNGSSSALSTLEQAHGTVMIIAWVVFASTGILFARYGRHLRVGQTGKLCGLDIWFQMHRAILIATGVITLVGLILIFVKGDNSSAKRNRNEQVMKAHEAIGFLIIGTTLVQIIMGFSRCKPQSRFRFIFNWIHRLGGVAGFLLSIPAFFLVIAVLTNYLAGLFIIMGLWVGWILIIVIILEIIQYRGRSSSPKVDDQRDNMKDAKGLNNMTFQSGPDDLTSSNANNAYCNTLTAVLFVSNVVVAFGFAITFIVLIWQQ